MKDANNRPATLHDHFPTDALQITAWACLAPLTAAFLIVFTLPMRARSEQEITDAT